MKLESVYCHLLNHFSPIDKDALFSGEWSIIIISNNGDCQPIDYIRQFSLSVGPQITSTIVPTITLTTTTTPISSTTITDVTTITSSAPPSTTTVQGAPSATITVHPLPTITIVTRGVFTVTSIAHVADIVATSTVLTSPFCAQAAFAEPTAESKVPDPVNNEIQVTILGSNAPRDLPAPTLIARRGGSALQKRRGREEIIEVRSISARGLDKRAPDEPTTTITESSSTATDFSTITLPTSFVTGTTTLVQTSTTTPTVTVSKRGARATTVTAPGITFTNTFFIPVTEVVVTRTDAVTATITSALPCN